MQAICDDGRVTNAEHRDSHVFACMRLLFQSVRCVLPLVEEQAASTSSWSVTRNDAETADKYSHTAGEIETPSSHRVV